MNPIRSVNIIRYIKPLPEGGSLPAITEADDDFMYVIKFKGAAQGIKALISELIGGMIAKHLGLNMPEIVFAELHEAFGRTESDKSIQDLLKASTGQNLGIHYLSGSITFDPLVEQINPLLASQILWLDSLILNVDRTAKNTNLLWWNKELWLIDHGASLYFHHSWSNWQALAEKPFLLVKDHVFLAQSTLLDEVDEAYRKILTPSIIEEIVQYIPEEWLVHDHPFPSAAEHRAAYITFLNTR